MKGIHVVASSHDFRYVAVCPHPAEELSAEYVETKGKTPDEVVADAQSRTPPGRYVRRIVERDSRREVWNCDTGWLDAATPEEGHHA